MRLLREFLDGSLKLCHAVARALLHSLSLIQQLPQLHHFLVYLSLHALNSRYQLTASSGNLAFDAIDHAIKAFLDGLNPHVGLLSLYLGVFNGVRHGGQLLSCVLGGVIQGFTLLVLLLLKLRLPSLQLVEELLDVIESGSQILLARALFLDLLLQTSYGSLDLLTELTVLHVILLESQHHPLL